MSAELFSCCIQGDKHPVYRVQTLRFACSFTTQKNFTCCIFTSRYCAQCFLALARSQYIRTGVLSISSPSLVKKSAGGAYIDLHCKRNGTRVMNFCARNLPISHPHPAVSLAKSAVLWCRGEARSRSFPRSAHSSRLCARGGA